MPEIPLQTRQLCLDALLCRRLGGLEARLHPRFPSFVRPWAIGFLTVIRIVIGNQSSPGSASGFQYGGTWQPPSGFAWGVIGLTGLCFLLTIKVIARQRKYCGVKIFKCVEESQSSMMDVEDEHNRMGAAFALREPVWSTGNYCSRMSTWRPRTAFGRRVCSQAGDSPMASGLPWRKSTSV